ncbi:hypothetical protein CKO12_09700 [Chromatium okenii]|uniref:type II toxin-antitoxin system MqsA family antitoxin n=1 Tax=Chromatium okenii TaxID=61644 RepID=UPI001906DE93|nr:type II toxin-antitoxin system MqsA family antitoxin [Chromatium okenii]MBK1642145.1 hypothetical protein [Chromatium okenii]
MKCVICKTGVIHAGHTTITLQRNESTVIIKNVSADICDNCGEYYLLEETTERVMAAAEDAIELAVTEAETNGLDETDHLLGNPANKARLLKALEAISHPRNLVHIELSDLEQRSVE